MTSDEEAIIEGLRAIARMLAKELEGALETSYREPVTPPPPPKAPPQAPAPPRPDHYINAQEFAEMLGWRSPLPGRGAGVYAVKWQAK